MSKKKGKPKPRPTDVIIVGSGIAGCVLAFHLANARLKVKVFEKKARKNLGHDWCDSVEKKAFAYAGIPAPKGKERKNDRDHLAIITPSFEKIVHLGFYNYWIVDRKLYQERLVKMAEKAGAEFFFETEIVEPIGKGQWVIGVRKKDGVIENSRIVVDCSGREKILGSNIEVLDLNYSLKEEDFTDAYRELHLVEGEDIEWGGHSIEKNILYYRYGYEKGFSWLNFEDDRTLDVGAGTGKGFSKRKPKAIVNDYVSTHSQVQKEIIRGGGDKVVIRRPITLVWYGFLIVGEAAAQTIPTAGCGVGSAMIGAKIAAEVIIKALRKKEVSIDTLWEYQVRFTQERGRDSSALDMMRRNLQMYFTDEDFSFLVKKGIVSKNDFEKLIHGKYPKVTVYKMITSAFKGITRPKIIWKMRKAATRANRIYKHYKKIPKEYDTRKYHEWMLRQMYMFKELEEE